MYDANTTTDAQIIWKQIPAYPRYEVSNIGKVRRVATSKRTRPYQTLNAWHDPDGYLQVSLYQDGRRYTRLVHHLVLFAHVCPRPSLDHCCDHINAVRDDNRVENLRWVTTAENIIFMHDRRRRLNAVHGTNAYGRKRG